jgi:hypothetical protein
MPPVRLGSRELLEYDARYGVLICRECQYAIQKSALQSHLLRHKIYRRERQHLLSCIARFDLFEPQHVPLPAPTSPPIDSLPIISGYRCTAAECGNLCASVKRMRRHWSEIHGLSEPPPNSSSIARPVKLQTFFRGTKLKYFEVASSLQADTAGATFDDENERHDNEERDKQRDGVDAATPQLPPPPQVPPRPVPPPFSSLADFNLEALTYFHHFTTNTSLTLPAAKYPQSGPHYWQVEVVFHALRRRSLMCGLLAISACHLAFLANETAIKQVHCERSVELSSQFSADWEATTTCDSDALAAGVKEEGKVARQVQGILRCAHWALAGSTPNHGIVLAPVFSSQLQAIVATIQGFIVPDSVLHPGIASSDDDDRQEETFAQAKRILGLGSSSDTGSLGNIPSGLLDSLGALPSCMAETFGRPDSAQDVFATLSAIAAIAECCEISFASNEVGVVSHGMVAWLLKVSDHFNYMASHHSPAALVVLAHWAAWLVQRAERCGCWFLRGSAKNILEQITEQLPAEDLAAQSLVRNLIVSD